jgi:hypothetical protein
MQQYQGAVPFLGGGGGGDGEQTINNTFTIKQLIRFGHDAYVIASGRDLRYM